MERQGHLGEIDDFGSDIGHYNYVFLELARDTQKTIHEVLEPLDQLIDYLNLELNRDPSRWEEYYNLIVKEFGTEKAKFIYARMVEKQSAN